MTKDYTETGAAKAWGVDWDRWQTLSLEARGVMLARYRAENDMVAWEVEVRRRKDAVLARNK